MYCLQRRNITAEEDCLQSFLEHILLNTLCKYSDKFSEPILTFMLKGQIEFGFYTKLYVELFLDGCNRW